jgi:hypothetical protein
MNNQYPISRSTLEGSNMGSPRQRRGLKKSKNTGTAD